jgi:Tat protein secretion system quality control protein TatD with DNase activity
MNKNLFDKYLKIAQETKNPDIISMIETWSPFSDCVETFGENPTKADFVSVWLQTTDENRIFTSRHYAERAKKESQFLNSSYHIIKVCAGGDKVGYKVISPSDFQIWKNQK